MDSTHSTDLKLKLFPTLDGPVLTLVPVTSQCTKRYINSKPAQPEASVITAGLFSYGTGPLPEYLPAGWTLHTNPEGRLYFHKEMTPTILTHENLLNHETLTRISSFISHIMHILVERRIELAQSVELFLELCDTPTSCNYYFVDHATRVEFWLEDLSTTVLGLPSTVSPSHLKFKLESHYWSHVECFPMHLHGQLVGLRDEVIGALVQAGTDRITSTGSPFPYTKDQCIDFLRIISHTGRDNIQDGNVVFTLARISSMIAEYKFFCNFGQEAVRFTRDQCITKPPKNKRSWSMAICSLILFGTPDAYVTKFEELYPDSLVWHDQWDLFILACRKDWKESMIWMFALLVSVNFVGVLSKITHFQD
ncbi:hypothetical protein JAAARDRAFT_659122 [Jaapia argillacea MUCL 33604]|uniref:WW domain-containing protein n=1 Tax=Jaapia argillacea MUCL 33604 TaxID=933084 RepID=A0A067PX51_9AGAM|nr:hypothetical protein JAAARDRAFT_659122 [Jaapia argillacea MUCL 33604]